jgi:ribosomal protein S18 acetylase RimI-like enzyme
MLIRPAATPVEVQAAAEVVRAAYAEFAATDLGRLANWPAYVREQTDTATRAREGLLLVAVDDAGAVTGTVTLYLTPALGSEHWDDGDAMLRFLAVLPAARGLGVGRALLDECVTRTKAAGRARLALHSAAPMTSAIGLYLREGFTRDPAGDWHDGELAVLGYALDLPGLA